MCPLRVRDFEPERDRKLLMGDFDAVYILAGKFQPAIGNLSQLVHQSHPGVPILLTPWARSPDVIGRIGPARASTLLASSFPARRDSEAVRHYLERFEQRFGVQPQCPVAQHTPVDRAARSSPGQWRPDTEPGEALPAVPARASNQPGPGAARSLWG